MAESPDTRLLSETNARQISVVRGEQYQDIRSHGAKCDGVTDDLDAFTKAFAAGRRVFVPAGVTRVRSAVLVPSNSELFGAGMDVSTIKLTDTASANTWVVTNSTRSIGNTNITIHDLTLDWNQPRQGGLDSTGGSRSSCLTFGNVQHGLVERVKAVNPGNHGFDVTSAAENYPYSGDGSPNATGPSRHVTIRDCVATGWGDDGFTTHHSEFITIENCYGYSPRKRANCNAFEVDDGSRDVTLINNRSAFCYGGVEIKAHADAPAATRVVVRGHRSYRDVLGLHVRHIGHIIATDATSLSAYDVEVHNFTVVEPGNRYGFQEETQAYAADIGSYRNILVDGFTAIADPAYDMAGNAPFLLRYMVNNGQFRNLKFRGFTTSTYDVYVTGGNNKADRVTIDGVDSYKSAQQVIGVGTGEPMVSIDNINAVAPDTGASYAINVGFSSKNINIGKSINLVGYPTAVRFTGINYPTVARFERRANRIPIGTTRLIDLDPTKDYYAEATTSADGTPGFDAMTDRPAGHSGINLIEHSVLAVNACIQTITRSTSAAGSQYQAYRQIDTGLKTAGPWNIVPINGQAPVSGGSTPSAPLPQPSIPYAVLASPTRVVNVSNRTQLLAALADMQWGDKIVLAAGSYGSLGATTPIRTPSVAGFTNSNPCPGVWIQGASGLTSIIGGGSTTSAGYSCTLDNANYLVLDRVKITGGQKGLMADETNFARVINSDIGNVGHEAVHFRNNSSDNYVFNCDIHDTGLDNPDYGEGVYFGQSVNNWDASMSRTNGQPDKSDRNVVEGCRILNISGECVDIKEGTTGGAVLNNTMSGKDISGANSADSYVDVKGNDYRIEGNVCTNPASFVVHGMSVHILYAGYGNRNIFKKNSVVAGGKTSGAENSVNGGSQGYNIQTAGSRGTTTGNIVYSDNTATANPGGLSNLPLTTA